MSLQGNQSAINATLTERLANVEDRIAEQGADIKDIKKDVAEMRGALMFLRWIIPVTISAAGIAIALATLKVSR